MNKLFLLFIFLILAFTSYSQENVLGKEITLNYDNISVENTLKEIEFKAKVTFSYNSDFFPVDSIISIHSTAPLNILLTTILGSQIEIKSIGNNIILRNKNTKVEKKAKKQKYDIKGVVIDSYTGNKLSEVTIYQIDGVRSALSKKDGSYNLKVASTASYVELSFSRKNYYDTIIMIKPSETNTIRMKLTPNVIAPITPRKVKDLPISSERTIDSSAFVKLLVPEKQKRLIDNIPFLGEPQPVQISLLPNIGSNLDMNAAMENKGSINILAGYSRAINGVEVGGGINIVRENVTGTQFAGFGNLVGGDIDGIEAAGFFNNVKGNMLGAQFAGFGNLVGGEVSGMQAAGFFNNNKGDVLGAQFAGFSNTSFGNIDGIQAAGFLNIAKESVEGVQIAGYINLTLKNTTGAQISNFINVTGDTLRKFQISGIANYAKYVEGLQIAALGNFAYKNVTGAQIAGLVNVTADTVQKMQLSGVANYAKNVKGAQFSTILNVAKNVHGLQFSLFNYG